MDPFFWAEIQFFGSKFLDLSRGNFWALEIIISARLFLIVLGTLNFDSGMVLATGAGLLFARSPL